MTEGISECAELHNRIVRLGWHVTSEPFVPFWERYSQYQEEMANLLSDDVVKFYKQALVPAGRVRAEDQYQNFFYYLQGLALPWEAKGYRAESPNLSVVGKSTRFVLLYLATKPFDGQQGGIVLDQETGLASVQKDLCSLKTASVVWQPLSKILNVYLNLIAIGKITAANLTNEIIRPGEAAPHYPWKYHSYSEEILARTLAAYHSLIAAIEAARSMPGHENDHELTVYLSTHFNLDTACFPKDSFARAFLTAARRPRGPQRIRFIAPGIALPSTTSIRNQPFKAVAKKHRFASGVQRMPSVSMEGGSDPLYPPLLLFPGEGTKPSGAGDRAVFAPPFDELKECPVGLWLDRAEPWSGRGGEDEAVVVGPFESFWTVSSPFEAGTRMPLFTVLEQWKDKVRDKEWHVDEKGVMGGVDLLRREKCQAGELRGRSRSRGTVSSV